MRILNFKKAFWAASTSPGISEESGGRWYGGVACNAPLHRRAVRALYRPSSVYHGARPFRPPPHARSALLVYNRYVELVADPDPRALQKAIEHVYETGHRLKWKVRSM